MDDYEYDPTIPVVKYNPLPSRKPRQVLDRGYVKLVEKWGSEMGIIEAARMSTSGEFRGWEKDQKLLAYLWTHKHMSPFEMAGATFEMQLPIFVARELVRHRTFSFNELSARYTELPNLYYIPSVERLMNGKQAKTNKQASEAGFDAETAGRLVEDYTSYSEQARLHYEGLLAAGVSRELARLVTPVNVYTRWRMSGNLRNWIQMLELRLGEGVQWEAKEYAKCVDSILTELFPRTMQLFKDGRSL